MQRVNKITLYILFMWIICLLSTPCAEADTRRINDSGENIAFSLNSLKESANQVSRKNKWLAQENDAYRRRINILERELLKLNARGDQPATDLELFGDYQEQGQKAQFLDAEAEKETAQPVRFFHERQSEYSGDSDEQKQRQTALLDDIIRMKQEATQLEYEIKQLKKRLEYSENNIDYISEKNRLQDLKKDSDINLQHRRKAMTALKKKYYKPLKELSRLKEKQILLKQQLVIAEDELKVALKADQDLRATISELEKVNKNNIDKITIDVDQLQTKRKELEASLAQVKGKLNEHNIDLTINNAEIIQLQDNLRILKKENNLLKKELFELKKEYNQAQRE